MGAFFTSLFAAATKQIQGRTSINGSHVSNVRLSSLQLLRLMAVRLLAYARSWRAVQLLEKLRLPRLVPSLEAVNRSAPYIFFGLYLPKLALDIHTIRKDVPVDEKLAEERRADLQEALARVDAVLYQFHKLDIPVPAGSRLESLKNHARAGIAEFFEEHGHPDTDTLSTLPHFALDDSVSKILASGDLAADTNDDVHDKLETLVSNLNVEVRKIVMPDAGSPLVGKASDALILVVMVRSFFDHALFQLICHKTVAFSQIQKAKRKTGGNDKGTETPEANAQLSKYSRKWAGGKPLVSYWNYNRRDFWWTTVDPWALPRHQRLRRHKQAWRNAVLERATIKARWKDRNKTLREGMVNVLLSLQHDFEHRRDLLAALQRSKMQKIFHALTMLIGSPFNWFMIIAGWVATTVSGMITGALVYYRSQLLITAQSVAQVAAERAAGHSNQSPVATLLARNVYNQLMQVVWAILIAQFGKIIVNDLSVRINSVGMDALKANLKVKLGEQLLSQDLETFDEARKNRKKNRDFVTSPEQLLMSFPLRKFVELPRAILGVAANVLTTTTLLWSKNRLMFIVVLTTLLAKQHAVTYITHLRDHLWFKYIWKSAHGNRKGAIGIVDALRNFDDVRINGNERHHLRQSRIADEVSGIISNRWISYSGIYRSFTNVINETPTTVTYLLGCRLIAGGRLAASDLVMFPSSVGRIIRECNQAWIQYRGIFDFEDSDVKRLDAIVEILNEVPSIGIGMLSHSRPSQTTPPNIGETEKPTEHVETDSFDATIEFQKVGFRRSTWPIKQADLTFKVPEGSFVAICGKNGVGKSTLFKLLLRLYDVDEGSITIGGKDIRTFDPIWLRSSCVAMAPQKPAIYRGTLRDNMTYGSEETWADRRATDAEKDAAIDKVLRRCGTLDMFKNRRSFPQGFDTRKPGHEMSGGQIRGVGLARALFREPRILLLDEPTNDLDPDVQQAVKKSLIEDRPLNQTILCITHSLATTSAADLILLLGKDPESGLTTIVARGTYDELMEHSEQFRRWHEYTWPTSTAIDGVDENADPAAISSFEQSSCTHHGDANDDELPEAGTLLAEQISSSEPHRQLDNADAPHTVRQFVVDDQGELLPGDVLIDPDLAEESDVLLTSDDATPREQWRRLLYRSLDVLPPAAAARLLPQYEELERTMSSRLQLWTDTEPLVPRSPGFETTSREDKSVRFAVEVQSHREEHDGPSDDRGVFSNGDRHVSVAAASKRPGSNRSTTSLEIRGPIPLRRVATYT